jgi:putative transposase
VRDATAFEAKSKFLIWDNEKSYDHTFERVAQASGIEVIHTSYKAPRANAICERFVGSLRRECLDHMLVIGELQLIRVLKEYVSYFNPARPHQGIAQQLPAPTVIPPGEAKARKVMAFPVLNGLHHDYR